MRLFVRVVPRASRSEVVGKDGQGYRIRIAAPPIEGEANHALIQFLASQLNIAPTSIKLLKGQGSKYKVLDIPLEPVVVERILQSRTQRTSS